MAFRRRRQPRIGAAPRPPTPGWLLLLVGLAVGAAGVLVTQLVLKRYGAADGLAGLFSPSKPPPQVKAPPPPKPAPQPKFDFYTVLPELETVLPDKAARDQPPKAATGEPASVYILQAGSFAGFQDADHLKARLALSGLIAQIQKITIEGRGTYHRVRLGPYARLEELDAADGQLRKLGVKSLRLKVKKTAVNADGRGPAQSSR